MAQGHPAARSAVWPAEQQPHPHRAAHSGDPARDARSARRAGPDRGFARTSFWCRRDSRGAATPATERVGRSECTAARPDPAGAMSMHAHPADAAWRERGFALLIVLWTLALLAFLVALFAAAARTEA